MFEKITEILKADTNDIHELMKIAGGNPDTFYIGSRWRKADLTNQDLTGIDWTGSDFIDAKLTDEQREYVSAFPRVKL